MMGVKSFRWAGLIAGAFTVVFLVGGVAQANHLLGGHWGVETHESVAHMTYVDNAASNWPVPAARQDWDDGTPDAELNIRPLDSDLSDCAHHCVTVKDLGWTENPNFDPYCSTAGVTSYGFGSNGHFTEGAVRVRFNRACLGVENSFKLRTNTCHEMGHALGLDEERSGTATCMYYALSGSTSNQPRTHDFDVLKSIYGHSP